MTSVEKFKELYNYTGDRKDYITVKDLCNELSINVSKKKQRVELELALGIELNDENIVRKNSGNVILGYKPIVSAKFVDVLGLFDELEKHENDNLKLMKDLDWYKRAWELSAKPKRILDVLGNPPE